MGKMYKVKITVLQKNFYPELGEKYLGIKDFAPCPCFEEGDVFIADGFLGCPEGFCAEAWHDVWNYCLAISRGGTFAPYAKEENQWVCCCTDGLRPVSFLLERDEEMQLPF